MSYQNSGLGHLSDPNLGNVLDYNQEAHNIWAKLGIDPKTLGKSGNGRVSKYSNIDLVYRSPEGGGIFVGDSQAAQDLNLLKQLGIGSVVNCTTDIPNYHKPHLQYFNFDVTWWKRQVKHLFGNTSPPNAAGPSLLCAVAAPKHTLTLEPRVAPLKMCPIRQGPATFGYQVGMFPSIGHEVSTEADIQRKLQDFLRPMLHFVDSSISRGRSVLVHCLAGAHRAGTTGTICLVHFGGLSAKRAEITAKSLRPIIQLIGDFPELVKLCDRLPRGPAGRLVV